jgi:hypothetical protein
MGGDHLWEAIGAIGQSLGSIAVFVTLGYLALQVRHARDEVRRSISQNRAEAARDLLIARATDARLPRLLASAYAALGREPHPFGQELVKLTGLTDDEAAALYFEQSAWWHFRAQVIPYVDELPAGERVAFDAGLRGYDRNALERLWYQTTKASLNPDAVRYIDDLLAQPG